jgi:chromate transport protein ChrA
MIETVAGFFVGFATGYLFTWPSLVMLFLFGTVFEYNGAQ